jgi:hypothetical protein
MRSKKSSDPGSAVLVTKPMQQTAQWIVASFLIVFLAIPMETMAQAQAGSNREWSAVTSLRLGSKLEIRLKNGGKTKGVLNDISETGITLSDKAISTSIKREDISDVYLVSGGSVLKPMAIGAGVGGGAGAIIGAATGDCNNSCIVSDGDVTAILAGIGAVAGTVTGLTIGLLRHKRTLIYKNS